MDGKNSLSEPYVSAILLATFSLLLVFLILPPMLWHLSNRNIGATGLILWLLILNFQDFLNAVLWPHDDISQWFDGNVLCDVEVKIMVAATVGVPSSVACVLRALAKVMDTERASLGLTKAQRRRRYAVDLLWCAGFPALQMFFHYVVQTRRYYVVGISGCTPAVSSTWVADLLIISPPVAWALVGGYYSALVLIRLHRYRSNFTALLANSNTSRSRFVRLFAICLVWLAISIPLQAYVISRQAVTEHLTFDWNRVHDPKVWENISMMPSGGSIVYTRYIWLASALFVFMFFGFGRDATRMYAKGLRAVGLSRCLPFLRNNNLNHTTSPRIASHSGTTNSISSKARLVFSRKSTSMTKSWATDLRSSKTTSPSMAEPLSPKTMRFMEPVPEKHSSPSISGSAVSSRFTGWLPGRRDAPSDVEKNAPAAPRRAHHSGFQRLTSPFRPVTASEEMPVPMNNTMRTQDVTVHSTVAGGPPSRSSSRVADQSGVMVRKEVMQGSEVV